MPATFRNLLFLPLRRPLAFLSSLLLALSIGMYARSYRTDDGIRHRSATGFFTACDSVSGRVVFICFDDACRTQIQPQLRGLTDSGYWNDTSGWLGFEPGESFGDSSYKFNSSGFSYDGDPLAVRSSDVALLIDYGPIDHFRELVIPYWAVCALFAIAPAFRIAAFARRALRRRRHSPGVRCSHCDYDLRAHAPGAHCPACGHPIPERL